MTEASFSSAKYAPVTAGSVTLQVEKVDFNHLSSGEQGVLTESLINFNPDTGVGQGTGYHFFIYNPLIHKTTDGTADCDLGEKLTDPNGHPFNILMMETLGEGPIPSERIVKGNEDYRGILTGKDCGYVITGVRSDGTVIPTDVWSRAQGLHKQAAAERAQKKQESVLATPESPDEGAKEKTND